MSNELRAKVHLELEKDMIFKCDMNVMKVKECYIDETHHDDMEMLGPNPTKLLATAVLGCLSASFIFCLQKKKLTIDDFKGTAEAVIARNDKGLFRVKEINVDLIPKSDDPNILRRIEQCKKIFETYCTITESVRAGIKVNVNIEVKK
ncbi:MAG: OsmC family protein [Candidatus Helarchaeota archaeon]